MFSSYASLFLKFKYTRGGAENLQKGNRTYSLYTAKIKLLIYQLHGIVEIVI